MRQPNNKENKTSVSDRNDWYKIRFESEGGGRRRKKRETEEGGAETRKETIPARLKYNSYEINDNALYSFKVKQETGPVSLVPLSCSYVTGIGFSHGTFSFSPLPSIYFSQRLLNPAMVDPFNPLL